MVYWEGRFEGARGVLEKKKNVTVNTGGDTEIENKRANSSHRIKAICV